MAEPIVIDTRMLGHEAITAAFVVSGEHTALVETGPRSTLPEVLRGLEAAGVETLDHIVVTHIHLDHAGAAGTLAQRFPRATIWVHPVGAPHLVDPSRLWSSAARIYGDEMESMWGGIDPLASDRVRVLDDGDTIDLGGRSLRAIETPGHASHHHAYLDDATGTIFAGDALGVRLPDLGFMWPATPPPEFDLEAAVASIERIRQVRPSALWLTHWGPTGSGVSPLSPEAACDAAVEALRRWEGWVTEARASSGGLDEVARFVKDRSRSYVEGALSEPQLRRLEGTSSYRMNAWGFSRYLDKKA